MMKLLFGAVAVIAAVKVALLAIGGILAIGAFFLAAFLSLFT